VRSAGETILLSDADASLEARFAVAIDAIDRVHVFPDSAPLIAVRGDDMLLVEAQYSPTEIRVHPGRPRRAIALLHEVGHFVDDQILLPGSLATESPELEGWRRAVLRSDSILALRELAVRPPTPGARQHLLYLLRFTETFARSYTQWVALRSDSDELAAELGDARAALNYSEFWDVDDFEEIAHELDKLLKFEESK
jgi:hypothetical protein